MGRVSETVLDMMGRVSETVLDTLGWVSATVLDVLGRIVETVETVGLNKRIGMDNNVSSRARVVECTVRVQEV